LSALQALLALGLGGTSDSVIARPSPPDVALYGTQKLTKTKPADAD